MESTKGQTLDADSAPPLATSDTMIGGGSGAGMGGLDGSAPTADGKKSGRRQLLEWIVLSGAAVLIALVVREHLIQAFYIPSDSMVPTLVRGDRVLVNKLSYKMHDVRRGDVIVFRAPPGTGDGRVKDLIKRAVGLPGDQIEGRDGKIYINGKLLDEPYLPEGLRSKTFGPVLVPPDRYWVMGDNRQNSSDSTYFLSVPGLQEQGGTIPRSSIVGRAFVLIWPFNNTGFL